MPEAVCPICDRTYINPTPHRVRKGCSKTCAQAAMKRERGPLWHRRIAQKGWTAAHRRKVARQADAKWATRWPGVPRAMAWAIYRQGYDAGYVTGRRTATRVLQDARTA